MYSYDHPRSGVIYNFEGVCLSVCLSITFESLDVGNFIFAHPVYLERIRIKFVYKRHQVKVKVIEANKRSIFSQCKASIGNNSVSITHRAVTFACSMWFSDMADRMVSVT